MDGLFLHFFVQLLVPRHLWQAMSRYATWIEPALLNEWSGLMQNYEGGARRTHDEHLVLLRWLDPEHDARLVRDFAMWVRVRNQALASPSPEDVFDGLMLQRATLKRDQQLVEWICC